MLLKQGINIVKIDFQKLTITSSTTTLFILNSSNWEKEIEEISRFLKLDSLKQDLINSDFFNKKQLTFLSYQTYSKLIFILKTCDSKKEILSAGGLASSLLKDVEKSTIYLSNDFLNNDILEGILLGFHNKLWYFNKYFQEKNKKHVSKIQNITISYLGDTTITENMFQEVISKVNNLHDSIVFTKELITEPANILTPQEFINRIKDLEILGIQVEVIDEDKAKDLKMGAFLSVGKASNNKSYIAILKWMGNPKSEKIYSLVGKGVTFDTGGLSIKPSASMATMKKDMSGAAIAVGVLKNLALSKSNINCIAVVGLAENSISSNATRPSDVVTPMSGKTIEILNTDAEGRMVLADVLHYTNITYNPSFIIDIATLTGAIIVSLGNQIAGLFSNNEELINNLNKASHVTAEPLWNMPLNTIADYQESLKSEIADLRNVSLSGDTPGSIYAALFLQEFIGKTPWAHLDVAGVVWSNKSNPYQNQGATGYGVYLLSKFLSFYFNT
jgi:leucyl aminopeptidase